MTVLHDYLKEEAQVFENHDLEEYYRINEGIHLTIAQASGNPVLIRYIEELLNRTKIYLILYDPFFSMPIYPTIHEHKQLVDALKTRNPDVAEKEMEIHLNSTFEGLDIQVLPEDYIALYNAISRSFHRCCVIANRFGKHILCNLI